VQSRHFANKEGRDSSDADVRTFFLQNTLDFLKFMVCPHEKGVRCRVSADIFGQGGRGQFFAILCRRP